MDLTRIGKYQIVAKIGSGAMGEVYRAHDPVLNRHVAVKTMSAVYASDDDLIERFRREAQSAARLNHPNIVTVFDFGEEQGKFYMAMELLEGVDLKEVIVQNLLPDVWDKLDLMDQITEGLAFAHAQGVVHRDLKPANIRIVPGGRVKIMDFGLARLNTSDMTKTGMVMGTPNYMSPEQVRGLKVDARTDVFSLGAVFYELLTGRKAFHADSMHTILFKVLEETPAPVQQVVPDVPAPLGALIDRALDKDPPRRFADAAEMRAALRRIRAALESGELELPEAAGSAAEATVLETSAPTLLGRRGPRSRAAVEGATALDVTRLSAPAERQSRTPGTLSARAATQRPQAARVPEGRPGRSLSSPLAIGGVLVGLLLAGAAAWLALRPGTPPAPPSGPDIEAARVSALTAALVGTQVELARAALQDKDYRDAIAKAEEALKLDPQSADARDVIARARFQVDAVERAAAEAQAAYQRGDTAAASRALSQVLALDPRHPTAVQLTSALNAHFRQQAEEASRAAQVARGAAQGVAGAAAQPPFAEAERLRGEAEALLGSQEFAVATQRLMEARDGYERARRTAEAAQRAAAAAAVAAARPPQTAPGMTQPPPTMAQLPPATAPLATLPPITAPPATAPLAVHEPAIRRVLADYGRAIEGKDLALFRRVKPNLSGDEQKRLEAAFKAVRSQQVGITVESIQVEGNAAVVRVSRQDTINGNAVQKVQQTFRLSQSGGGWVIESIGQ